jgi:hypothetical protein
MRSKTLKQDIVSIMVTKKVAGVSNGTVTFRKDCHDEAPSILAAS